MTQEQEGKIIPTKADIQKLEPIMKEYTTVHQNMITLLQEVQEKFGYLPKHILNYVSDELKVPLAKIYGIATFYAQFSFTPKGKFVITVCDGTACHVKGAPLLQEFLETELKIKPGETTKDLGFTLQIVACLGCCGIAPVAFVNENVHGDLTPAKLKVILNKYRKELQPKGAK